MDKLEFMLKQSANKAKLAYEREQAIYDSYVKFKEGLSDPRLSHTRAQLGNIWMYFHDESSPTGVLLHCSVSYEIGTHLLAEFKSSAPLLPKHQSYSY